MEERLEINEKSIQTTLSSYREKPLDCISEYIWNSFDASATQVLLRFDAPMEGIGTVKNVQLFDNGKGWNLDNIATTNTFISSLKEPEPHKSLPKGRYGRGRYAFIWICNELQVYSGDRKMTLTPDTHLKKEVITETISGTRIDFVGVKDVFSDVLLSETALSRHLILEFGWLLRQNPELKIIINDTILDVDSLVEEKREYAKADLPIDLQAQVADDFSAEIIVWREKPSEFSRFYFLNESSVEICKLGTGLNKKKDDFWHSVYIRSSQFKDAVALLHEEKEKEPEIPLFQSALIKKLQNRLKRFFVQELIAIRRPYLVERSVTLYDELSENNLLPNLSDFGIYDEQSFGDLIKTIYTITPSLFVGKSDTERQFICSTFAGLLSTQDDSIIQILLNQVQELTDEEKRELKDILERTTLSNVIRTVKEIDNRLYVINSLEKLLFEYEKDTLEVKHLQKILDENFWIFGEQFRLFSSTEGQLSRTLKKYASEILEISEDEIDSDSRKELDLFLTRQEVALSGKHTTNVIVELKRPSIKLGKEEYDQIEKYMELITAESACNGENQYWEFYLIGNDYNDHISNKIESAQNHGEKDRGLCSKIKEGRVKLYVRKWSDILEVEWRYKLKYLSDKLNIKPQRIEESSSPAGIVTAIRTLT